jgi:hypothetical protein
MDPEKKLPRITNWEYIVPALAIGSLTVSCIMVSSKKYFWNDELQSYYLLGDHSFRHMMVAFSDKFTNVPPLYFVLGWLWARGFGATEISLRLFSSFGISIACLVTWITLRRNYQFWPAAVGTLGIFCVSDLILAQNAEARMYGLFLAACALGVLQTDIINKRQNCPRRTLVLNALIHVAIVQTHLFGIFYSGAILGGFIIRDRFFGVFRLKIYLSIVLGWLSLIPYLPVFLKQADAGRPRTWIPVPDLSKLMESLIPSVSPFFSLVIMLLVVISAIQFVSRAALDPQHSQLAKQTRPELRAEISLVILACMFLAIPVCVWIVSHTIKPLFILRYMIPSVLGWSILLAYLCSRISWPGKSGWPGVSERRLSAVPLLALSVILLIHPIAYAWSRKKELFPGGNDGKYGYGNLPIVAPFSHDFMKRFHYSPERERYFFILDWEAALDVKSGLFSPQEYKAMDALKRDYQDVFDGNIIQIWDFLRTHNRFLVLDSANYQRKCTPQDFHCPWWLEMRIKNNPDYEVTALGVVDGRRLLLIQKMR